MTQMRQQNGWYAFSIGVCVGRGPRWIRYTVHVGDDAGYLALYRPQGDLLPAEAQYRRVNGLNHIGIVVDDIDAIENAVKLEGFTPNAHADYEPGRRFYFLDNTGLEFEIVHYDD